MKSKIALICLFSAIFVSVLCADDDRSTRMLRKADEILRQTDVVSDIAVGYSGECPEANWALSVICASKEKPIDHLLELSEECRPAGFVMCLLGVRALDGKRFAVEFASRRKMIEDSKLSVETATGCTLGKQAMLEILDDARSWSRQSLLREPIPELWDTIRIEPTRDFGKESSKR